MQLKTMVQRYYDIIRPYLPRRTGSYRGYVARDDRLLDITTSRPNYKEGLVNAIKQHAPGSNVCIVAFGRGISSMIAIESGASSVTAYEASAEMIEIGIEAFDLNDISTEKLTVKHALVGEAIAVFGSIEEADVISPADLNPKDVLVLDCEGAERSIINGLKSLPSIVIVEAHPEHGVSTEDIQCTLTEHDFDVRVVPYEPGKGQKRVLIGTR